MSLFQRGARLAALSLTLAGALGASTVGHATEVERGIAPSTVVAAAVTIALPPIADPAAADLADSAVASSGSAPARFASLSEAVAAQDVGAGDEDLRCLAGAIYFESKGEPLTGQLAVAQVVLNRVKSGRFRSDVCGVVTQPGQFSFVRGGAIPAIDKGKLAYRTAVAVAKVALKEAWNTPAEDALFFNAARITRAGATRVAAIGNHVFYR